MKVLVTPKAGRYKSVRRAVLGLPRVDFVYALGQGKMAAYIHEKITSKQKKKIDEIERMFSKISHIDYAMYPAKSRKSQSEHKRRSYHFFLDIDHTLTDNAKGEIDSRAMRAFKEMKKRGHIIHFATGRDHLDLETQIKKFNISPRGIAENGGIILGFSKELKLY